MAPALFLLFASLALLAFEGGFHCLRINKNIVHLFLWSLFLHLKKVIIIAILSSIKEASLPN